MKRKNSDWLIMHYALIVMGYAKPPCAAALIQECIIESL